MTNSKVAVGIERDGKFLIVKRATEGFGRGLWEFPGGRVESGENPDDAARREAYEETGLKLKSVRYAGRFERPTQDERKRVAVFLFRSGGFEGKVRLGMEHDEFRWCSRAEIIKMASQNQIGIDTVKFFETSSDE